jgi:hypothetical protein
VDGFGDGRGRITVCFFSSFLTFKGFMSDLPLPSVALGMAPPDPPSLLPSVWLRRIVRHLSFYSLSPAEAVLPAGVVAAATTARGRQDVRAPPLSSSCPFRSSTRTLCDEKSDHDLNVMVFRSVLFFGVALCDEKYIGLESI